LETFSNNEFCGSENIMAALFEQEHDDPLSLSEANAPAFLSNAHIPEQNISPTLTRRHTSGGPMLFDIAKLISSLLLSFKLEYLLQAF
jgi:hypothetical protein